jgi:hypothetical protein
VITITVVSFFFCDGGVTALDLGILVDKAAAQGQVTD